MTETYVLDVATGDDASIRSFHEPWYVVNIIQNGNMFLIIT